MYLHYRKANILNTMGIPFFYGNLIKQHPNISKISLGNTHINTFYLDYNGIIHPVLHKYLTLHNNQLDNEQDFFDFLWEETLQIIGTISPDNVNICVDGVAPLAKIVQQRKRRYVSFVEKQGSNGFDTNIVTCGTPFMERLCRFLGDKCRHHGFVFDDNNGEGEHKIFEYIHRSPDETVLIHGLDADLILLSLMSDCQKIFLVRENNNNKNEQTTYIDIQVLRKIILSEFQCINSYVVLYTLLGNDFIPHPITVNLSMHGIMDRLKTLHKQFGPLVRETGDIDHECLTNILMALASTEDNDILNLYKKYDDDGAVKLKKSNNWRKTYYNDVIYCKDPKMASYKFVQGIYWTYSYYNKRNHKLHHSWFYPYYGAPTMQDIANIAICESNFQPTEATNDPVTTYIPKEIKLLIVLPKASKHILPEHLRDYMDNPEKGLTYMYPDKFKMIKLFKKHQWEYVPILPLIDVANIIQLTGFYQ